MTQPGFIFARDSHVLEPVELARLSQQNRAILARLEQGPVTNAELAGIALKYTSRISDLRKYLQPRGRDVSILKREGGTVTYGLVNSRPESDDI